MALLVITAITCCITSAVPIFFVSYEQQDRINQMYTVCVLIVTVFRFFYVLQFTLVTSALFTRFAALNGRLSSLLKTKNIKIVKPRYFPIFRFGNLYHGLCDGIGIVNENFTIQMAFLYANILVSRIKNLVFC